MSHGETSETQTDASKKTDSTQTARDHAASHAHIFGGGAVIPMGLHDVVRVVKFLEKNRKLARFVNNAKAAEADATFDAKAVNFVKDFMVKNKLHTQEIGKHIVNAREPGAEADVRGGITRKYRCSFS
jgi:hypothetical protein